MGNKPLISIVTVCYNAETVIEETILSVVNQTYPNIEYIIIDGGSSDGTINLIKKYEDKIDYWISESDKGIYDAMNKGLEKTTGTWINFMNAGDVFTNNQIVSKIFSESIDEHIGIICGKHWESIKGIIKQNIDILPFHKNPNKFKPMSFNHQSVFVRSDIAKKIGFNLMFKVCADYNMIYSIYKQGYNIDFKTYPICIIDMDGFSSKYRNIQRLEVAKICGCDKDFSFILWHFYCSFKLFVKKIIKKL